MLVVLPLVYRQMEAAAPGNSSCRAWICQLPTVALPHSQNQEQSSPRMDRPAGRQLGPAWSQSRPATHTAYQHTRSVRGGAGTAARACSGACAARRQQGRQQHQPGRADLRACAPGTCAAAASVGASRAASAGALAAPAASGGATPVPPRAPASPGTATSAPGSGPGSCVSVQVRRRRARERPAEAAVCKRGW